MGSERSTSIVVAAAIILVAVVGFLVLGNASEADVRVAHEGQGFWYFEDKRFWDYLDLLIVPLLLGIGGTWFSSKLDMRAQEIENRQAQERELDAELESYFRQIQQLFSHEDLRNVDGASEARDFAIGHTKALLEDLDGTRKKRLLAFLYESNLIKRPEAVIPLCDADLSDAKLRGAYLKEADLREVDLQSADLRNANLVRANLHRANLDHADLNEAKTKNTPHGGCAERSTVLRCSEDKRPNNE